MAHNGTPNAALTPKQEAVALALAAGKTIREAAAECAAGERTIKRWLAERPDLARRATVLRGEMVNRALGKMADGMTAAADTLRTLLNTEAESIRLGAARSLLELGTKLRESVELEARLQALEARQSQSCEVVHGR
jgi:predicted transcriptional regulator